MKAAIREVLAWVGVLVAMAGTGYMVHRTGRDPFVADSDLHDGARFWLWAVWGLFWLWSMNRREA